LFFTDVRVPAPTCLVRKAAVSSPHAEPAARARDDRRLTPSPWPSRRMRTRCGTREARPSAADRVVPAQPVRARRDAPSWPAPAPHPTRRSWPTPATSATAGSQHGQVVETELCNRVTDRCASCTAATLHARVPGRPGVGRQPDSSPSSAAPPRSEGDHRPAAWACSNGQKSCRHPTIAAYTSPPPSAGAGPVCAVAGKTYSCWAG